MNHSHEPPLFMND